MSQGSSESIIGTSVILAHVFQKIAWFVRFGMYSNWESMSVFGGSSATIMRFFVT